MLQTKTLIQIGWQKKWYSRMNNTNKYIVSAGGMFTDVIAVVETKVANGTVIIM